MTTLIDRIWGEASEKAHKHKNDFFYNTQSLGVFPEAVLENIIVVLDTAMCKLWVPCVGLREGWASYKQTDVRYICPIGRNLSKVL